MNTPPDELVQALSEDGELRVLVGILTNTCRSAGAIHDTGPVATLALSHALIAACLLRGTYKASEQVHLQFDGTGPLGVLIARALPGGDVYGTVGTPHLDVDADEDGTLPVGSAIGTHGRLVVSRQQPGAMAYSGMTELSTGRVADEVMHYLSTSEQIRSAVGLGVRLEREERVAAAGGFLIQVVGGVPEERLQRIDARIASVAELGQWVHEGGDAERLLRRLVGEEGFRVVGRTPIRYAAPHDRNYYLLRIASLGRGDLDTIFGTDEEIEIVCEFTRERHIFSRSEIERCAASLKTLD
jgi:molecular chaperone Hsp33